MQIFSLNERKYMFKFLVVILKYIKEIAEEENIRRCHHLNVSHETAVGSGKDGGWYSSGTHRHHPNAQLIRIQKFNDDTSVYTLHPQLFQSQEADKCRFSIL